MAMSSDAALPTTSTVDASRPAIRVRGVGKAYKIYAHNGDLLREVLSGRARHREHWALKDVSFDVPRGSVVGIIGANGSGKSTLLKIVAGLLDTTAGTVDVNGKISAILELGTGFHPDFTGRENIITGGMCLGMTREEIESKAPWIIEFSELASVMDQPFRTYSSGMQARLTFSTAVAIDPDILIIDEALAAGDSYFVAKCFKRIREICASGATVLFVSHGTNQVASLCNQAIWLEDGRVKEIGPAREVTKHYDYAQHVRISQNVGRIVEIEAPPSTAASPAAPAPSAALPTEPPGPSKDAPELLEAATTADLVASPAQPPIDKDRDDARETVKIYRRGPIVIDDVVFSDETGKPTTIFRTWDTMRISVRYRCEGELPRETLGLAIGIERERDLLMMAQFNTINPAGNETVAYEDAPFRVQPGRTGVISGTLPNLQMLEGTYILSAGIQANTPGAVEFYEYHHRVYRFTVVPAGYPSGAVYYPIVEWAHDPET